jgi:predicted glycosyltransferase
VLYSHDGFGLGHLKRNYNIASALLAKAPDVNVLLIASCSTIGQIELLPGMDLIKLPSLKKVGDECWEPRTLHVSCDDLMKGRRAIIKSSIEWFEPDLILVDFMPRGVYGELDDVLAYIRRRYWGVKCLLGVRDIIDDPARLRRRWIEDRSYTQLTSSFDHVLIYGAESIYPTVSVYELENIVGIDTRYVGYVSGVRGRTNTFPSFDLAVVGGGGADAFPMISRVLEALRKLGAKCPTTIIATGPLMSAAERHQLDELAVNLPVELRTGPVDQVAIMASARALVTMAGYNTVIETIELGKSSLIIPRPGPSAEQTIRAQRIAELGIASTLPLAQATPIKLSKQILQLVAETGNKRAQTYTDIFPVDGAANAAAFILEAVGWRSEDDKPRVAVQRI